MGKSNQGQRTKGNTRPSSSGHSAELLNSSGKPFSGFIGFDTLSKEIASYVPVTGQHSLDDMDKSVDATFRMIMRKMLKRDPTTRLKAVQEFGDRCCEENKDVIKSALPFWPRLFNKLALDTDRRIREATHASNGKLISKVKRDIAPYLKSIMGVWLLGQCDLYAPSASTAQTAFLETFPSPKQSEALIFCKAEIFSYYKDNLFQQTAKSLSEPNPTSEEDVENKYNLVISSTFFALRLLLLTLAQNDRDNIKEEFTALLSDNKFWKYSKFKNSQIRGSWFSLLSRLCQDLPCVFENFESKLSTSIFSSLSESDPIVAPAVWQSALHTIANIKDVWNYVDVHKVVLPQIWTLLKEGGKGNATVLFPCLLPLLCKLPREVTSKESFHQQFLTYLRLSVQQENNKVSAAECDAIIVVFMECLEFFIFHHLDFKNDGSLLLQKIANDQLMPLTEYAFMDKNRSLSHSKLFSCLGSFVQKMEKKFFNENDKDTAVAYEIFLTMFWEHIDKICAYCFSGSLERNQKLSEFLMKFFHAVYSPSDLVFRKSKSKVKFMDNLEGNDGQINAQGDMIEQTNPNLLKQGSHTLQHTIKFCEMLCTKINGAAELELCYVKLLSELIFIAKSYSLFEGLVKELKDSSDNKEKPAPIRFFYANILCWIKKSNGKSHLGYVIDIIFTICSCVETVEALNILNECCKINHAILMEELLRKGIESHLKEVFIDWLEKPILLKTVTDLIKDTVSTLTQTSELSLNLDTTSQLNSLHFYLSGFNLTASESNAKGILNILTILKDSLEVCCEDKMTSRPVLISFICDVTITMIKHHKECLNDPRLEQVLVLIFRHSLKQSIIADDLLKKCVTTWQMAIEISIKNDCQLLGENGFVRKAANEIYCLIINTKSVDIFSDLLDRGFSLLSTIEETFNLTDASLQPKLCMLSVLLERILPSDNDWITLKKTLHLDFMPALLGRRIFYPFPDMNATPTSAESSPQYVMVAEFVSDILIKEIDRFKDERDQKAIEECIRKHISHLLWSFSYCESNGHLTRQGTTECERTETLQKSCFKMLAFLSQEKLIDLIKILFNLSLSEGLEWAFCLQTIIEITKTIHPECVPNVFELLEQARMSNGNIQNKYVTAQILIHHVSTEQKIALLSPLTYEFLSLNEGGNLTKDAYLGTLSQVCCCIQDSDVLQSPEVQMLITQIMISIAEQKQASARTCGNEFDLAFQTLSLLFAITKYAPSVLNPLMWDLIFECLTSSLQRCRLFIPQMRSSDFMLLHETSALLYVVTLLLADDNEQSDLLLEQPKSLWKNRVFKDVYQDFLFMYIFLADMTKTMKPLPRTIECLLSTVSEVTEFIPGDLMINTLKAHVLLNNLLMNTGLNPSERAPVNDMENFNSILKMVTPYLTSSIHSIQFAAHSMIIRCIPLIPDAIKNPRSDADEEEDDRIPIRLYVLVEQLITTNQIVESMLLDVKVGDCCCVLPYTDSYVYSMAYLLAWIEIFELFTWSSSQVHTGYATYLEESKLLTSLFSNVYRLMPENPIHNLKNTDGSDSPRKECYRAVFMNPPVLSSLDHPSSETLQTVACYVYCTALRKVPSSVRNWWNNLDKRSAEIVDRFTSKYISGILISDEIQSVCDSGVKFNNMTVRPRPKEVVATYTVDDNAIELYVQLPRNYPLGPVTAEKRGQIEIAQQEWRHWLMQLTAVLTIQNRSVLDGLTIWAKNLDKKFEGVEECTICYFILHVKSYKLPKLTCHVCGKKFHAACLYKWFRTSNQSSCPLCRNEFH